ncbi:MAG: CDP-paratose 2-epimerase [Candidatus Magasanikbacteria bacterium CG10_big_fil_rev_8_21_14_0_10_36_32]|uniref:CDP-paratose 2-epimerase n=1 Tax=Candidatus Magasanikbacteria bacterium CG10_big_fil_rev_8_21_14_0_10_36_32 TaxID=1974646 RepID=A0A2M6W5T1_9BACT|nr:MAG: CDP-paratose 2-epimerase [Candidatus Magasanikbacteria bacterium CG10_big_fil_rev_8_21_14_0_10_36_32]
MKYLITGGCGFLGSNLAREALERGIDLVIFDNLSRLGSEQNLSWLNSLGKFDFIRGDIRNNDEVEQMIKNEKPNVIFHLAGQVAMTTSIQNPRMDFETNAVGTFNLLDSVRKFSPDSTIIYSSTNKVYGDLEWLEYNEKEKRYEIEKYPVGLIESVPLSFSSPYGCSKGSADQYMLDFHRVFGLKTVVFRHSSMYGGRQFSTIDQGWIGWFCEQAIKTARGQLTEPFTISGNGKQVRDVLHADDMINLYFSAVEKIDKIKGEVFNIGGGYENSLSLLELFDVLEQELNIKLSYKEIPVRESDQKVFIANIEKAKRLIGWQPKISTRQGIKKMLEWIDKKE